MAGRARRGGLSSFLTGLRLVFNTPLRVLVRRLAETVDVIDEVDDVLDLAEEMASRGLRSSISCPSAGGGT